MTRDYKAAWSFVIRKLKTAFIRKKLSCKKILIIFCNWNNLWSYLQTRPLQSAVYSKALKPQFSAVFYGICIYNLVLVIFVIAFKYSCVKKKLYMWIIFLRVYYLPTIYIFWSCYSVILILHHNCHHHHHHHHICFNICFLSLHGLDGFLWKTFRHFCH